MKNASNAMSETPLPTRGLTPTVPQKRPFGLEEEQHVPAVSSPLNPDSASARARKQPAREQREKKESLRKREAKAVEGNRHGTPDAPSQGKKAKKTAPAAIILSPIRYKLAAPKPSDFDPPKSPVFTPTYTRAGRQFYETSEQYGHAFDTDLRYLLISTVSTTAKVSVMFTVSPIQHFHPLNIIEGRRPNLMVHGSISRMRRLTSSLISLAKLSPRKRAIEWHERALVFERAAGTGNAKLSAASGLPEA